MRLFTAINLPEDVAERLERLLVRLRPAAHLKWTPVDNLHVTTKFIGEWAQERLDELQNALRGLPWRPPFSVSIHGLGWFPNPHNPRVFWAGVQGGPPLSALATDTEEALEPIGIARESRPFSPHLTLARISQPAPLSNIRQAVAKLESVDFGTFEVTGFHLFHSRPGHTGSVYTPISDFPFSA